MTTTDTTHISKTKTSPRWRNAARVLVSLAQCLRSHDRMAYLATMASIPPAQVAGSARQRAG